MKKYKRNGIYLVSSILLLALCLSFSMTATVAAESDTEFEIEFTNEQIEQWNNELLRQIDRAPELGDFKLGNHAGLRSVGAWTWRDGVICVTNSVSSIIGISVDHGHAGIIAAAPYYYATIEANPGNGVHVSYGEWTTKYSGQVWQVGVTSTTVEQDHQAALSAAQHIGKNYRFPVSLNNRNEFYCSHLVYAAYKDATGVNLAVGNIPGLVLPYDLLNTSVVSLIYQKN